MHDDEQSRQRRESQRDETVGQDSPKTTVATGWTIAPRARAASCARPPEGQRMVSTPVPPTLLAALEPYR
jgi:hypothetical protein